MTFTKGCGFKSFFVALMSLGVKIFLIEFFRVLEELVVKIFLSPTSLFLHVTFTSFYIDNLNLSVKETNSKIVFLSMYQFKIGILNHIFPLVLTNVD